MPPDVHQAAHRGGQPLAAGTRAFMEPRFGQDFSDVRVHADGQAASSVEPLGVRAYTLGEHMVFGPGRYAPGTDAGHRLIAHELAHVVQQRRGGAGGGAGAETGARKAATQVAGGGAVSPELVGSAPPGLYADDGREGASPSFGSASPRLGGPSLVGPLRISAQIVEDLRKRGLLSVQLLQLIDSGQIVVEPDLATGGMATGGPATAGTKDVAREFNVLPSRFGLGAGGFPSLFGSQPAAPTVPPVQSLRVGGYLDPVVGYIPPQVVTWTPSPTPAKPAQSAQGEPSWLEKLVADLRASFDFSEGLTIRSVNQPGVSTTIWVTGITQKLFETRKGLAGQAELGWSGDVGFQLSYRNWFLHGNADKDGKWGLTLSFPNDAPLPVLPWMNDIVRESGVAVRGLAGIAAQVLPNPSKLDSLKGQISPHIDRIKNTVDAANGVRKAQPGLNVAVSVGSGPRPGATPTEAPSGFFIGGSLVGTF